MVCSLAKAKQQVFEVSEMICLSASSTKRHQASAVVKQIHNIFVSMLQSIKNAFQKFPFHLVLLPLFFICSKYIQYEGLLDNYETLKAGIWIAVFLVAGLYIFSFFLKDLLKASIATTCMAALFLFFGDLREGLQNTPSLRFLSMYKIFLPVIALLLLILFIALKKNKPAHTATLFLNILFLIYTGTEGSKFIRLKSHTKQRNQQIKFTTDIADDLRKQLPDIYFIVPDCYPSSSYQFEMLHTDNIPFEHELEKTGFRVLKNSRSNFNRTAFSLQGTFTLTYPSELKNKMIPDATDYTRAINSIKSAPLFTFLQQNGYEIINLSIADIADKPALRKETFLSTTTYQMIFGFTFWNYFSRDIFYHWIANKKQYKKNLEQAHFEPLKKYSITVTDSLVKGNKATTEHPQFVYAHLSFPHYPYFYDSAGRAYSADSIYNDSMITDRQKFAGYIKYSNNQLLKIISSVLARTNGNAVIILQSDHGISDLDTRKENDAFRNFSAFYFPDKDYGLLYDSMSNVNTFRVLLNKYFGQRLPLLPDSSITISIK